MRAFLWVAVVVVGLLSSTVAVTQAQAADLFARSATVSYQPADGARDVPVTEQVSVSATNGTFEKVELVADDGSTASGVFSSGRTVWTTDKPLHYASTYTWRGTVRGADDSATELAGTLSTIVPARKTAARLNVDDDDVVGVATPIMVQFDGPVADKAAVERALRITTSVPVEGSWGWLPDEPEGARVHWRPRGYWPAGTKVQLEANFVGVEFGDGAWGANNVSTQFTIGRAQVVQADVRGFRMKVLRDGAVIADYPASFGVDTDPERSTRSGIHVVTEKFEQRRMVSQRFDYDVVMQWAVRISNNGEFIHANPATVGAQGSRNVSHGCVNLSTENAKAYWDIAQYGDPVEVTGSGVRLSARDGDVWDWTLSWDQWRRLSALDQS